LSTSFGKILTDVMFPLVYTADLPSPGYNLLLEIKRTNIGESIYRVNNELHLLGTPQKIRILVQFYNHRI